MHYFASLWFYNVHAMISRFYRILGDPELFSISNRSLSASFLACFSKLQ